MHIVYKIVFNKRKKNNEFPYFYIGSKSNCTFTSGKIFDKRGKTYWGSSSWSNYLDIVESDDCTVEILMVSDDYMKILEEEKKIHIHLDVVASPEYFNKSVASTNNYSNPEFATYKHKLHGKTVRLPRNHPSVLSGDYVGVSLGTNLSDETKIKIGRACFTNSFYGKTHTIETKEKISRKNKGRIKTPHEISNWVEKVAKLPMSDEHKVKVSKANTNKATLKNFITGECIRINCSDIHSYDRTIWKNPATVQKKFKCLYCGIETNRGNLNRWHNENCNKRKDNESN
jgi:hypothetical protein